MRRSRAPLLRVADERGATMIEVVVAAMVMAIAVTGVIGSMGVGMSLVGHGRQRTTGVSVANERIENAHNIPYEQLGLNTTPTTNPDPEHPDHMVTSDGRFEVEDKAVGRCAAGDLCEKLHVGGTFLHVEDPYTPPGQETVFRVVQYVTWVDDPAVGDTEPAIAGIQSYKRVVIIVRWKFPVASGTNTTARLATFVSKGHVEVPATTAAPSASPSPPPLASTPPLNPNQLGIGQLVPGVTTAPKPNPANPCPTDLTGPAPPPSPDFAVFVVSGSGTEQGFLASTSVQVRVRMRETCKPLTVEFSNVSATAGFQDGGTGLTGTGNTIDAVVQWIIDGGDGTKAFWARFRDDQGNYSGTYVTYVVLDTAKPTAPTNLVVSSCSISGSDRTVAMAWSGSTDEPGQSSTGSPPLTTLSGYRLYKSIESGAFTIVKSMVTTTASDIDRKSYNALRYRIRAYDKAGNESLDSNTLTFTKNLC